MNNNKLSNGIRFVGGRVGVFRLVLLAGMLLFFGATLSGFWGSQNFYALFQSFALLGLVTLGLSMTMIVGEFDLSVGAMVAVAGLITLKFGGDVLWPGIVLALGFAMIVGLVNAALFSWLNISSLVITVGTMMTLSGLAVWLADGRVISTYNFDLGEMLDAPIMGIFSWRSLLAVAAFPIIFLMFRYTLIGRDIIATGSNTVAARAGGVRVVLSYCIAFVVSSMFAALAGSLLAISLATATATMGSDILLQAASAAIIGGVSLNGGVGRLLGIFAGVMTLTVLNNGLSLFGASAALILFANGSVLLLVVLIESDLGRHVRQMCLGWRRARKVAC